MRLPKQFEASSYLTRQITDFVFNCKRACLAMKMFRSP